MSSASRAAPRRAFCRRSTATRARRPMSLRAATATTSRPMSTTCRLGTNDGMKLLLLGSVACLATAVLFLLLRGSSAAAVPLDVELKVTDEDYHPLAGVPVRLVFGTRDWQAP